MKINFSKIVLPTTIHMSHDSAENPFPFFEFEHDVLHVNGTEESWLLDFSARWLTSGDEHDGHSKP